MNLEAMFLSIIYNNIRLTLLSFLPFRFDAADKGEDFDKTVEDIKSKPKED